MNCIIIGGSDFIGTHLIHLLIKYIQRTSKIYNLDIVMLGNQLKALTKKLVLKNNGVFLDISKSV